VSDVYVRIGTDFNHTLHAFSYHQIDTSDIHSVPKDLRDVLERCLGEDASPDVLTTYLPEIRQVLLRLLQGLLTKKNAWKAVSVGQSGVLPAY